MATRSQNSGSVEIQEEQGVKKKVENSWVMLVRENLLEDNEQISIVTLPHPGSGLPTKYCFDRANSKVLEVVVYDEPNRSWFIGETVKSDGKLHIATQVNPTFLVLPRLIEECSNKAVPLSDLLAEKGFHQILDYLPNLDHVADLKGPTEMNAYKYSESKTMAWLEARVRRVAAALRLRRVHVGAGAASATFISSSKKDTHLDEEFFLRYAHGVVSHYLSESLAESLEKHFDFKPELIETLSKKRKSETEENVDKKKVMKTESFDEHKENSMASPNQSIIGSTAKALKPATLTNKEKARQKAASGSKAISSFFTKK